MGGGLLMTENLNDYYREWEWYPSLQMYVDVEGGKVGEF